MREEAQRYLHHLGLLVCLRAYSDCVAACAINECVSINWALAIHGYGIYHVSSILSGACQLGLWYILSEIHETRTHSQRLMRQQVSSFGACVCQNFSPTRTNHICGLQLWKLMCQALWLCDAGCDQVLGPTATWLVIRGIARKIATLLINNWLCAFC